MSDNAPHVPTPGDDDPAALDAPGDPLELATGDALVDPPIPVPDDGLGEWPTHGGPLGCLVSIVFGCLIASFISSPLLQIVQLQHFGKGVPAGWYIFATVVIVLTITIFFGWLGWQIGKRIFREYAPSERARRIAEQVDRAASSPS